MQFLKMGNVSSYKLHDEDLFSRKKGDDDDELEEKRDSTRKMQKLQLLKSILRKRHNIITISLCASQTLLSANFVAAATFRSLLSIHSSAGINYFR